MRPLFKCGQLVRTIAPLTVWILCETVLSGEYLVTGVRPDAVRVEGVWIPSRFVEATA